MTSSSNPQRVSQLAQRLQGAVPGISEAALAQSLHRLVPGGGRRPGQHHAARMGESTASTIKKVGKLAYLQFSWLYI